MGPFQAPLSFPPPPTAGGTAERLEGAQFDAPSFEPPSEMHCPRFPYFGSAAARSALQRSPSVGVAAVAPSADCLAAASFFAVNDTHLPNRFFFSLPPFVLVAKSVV